jgi:hypothetical protein
MLQAFFDESYDDEIFVMAGWVAPAKTWALFSNEWQQFLDMKPAIQYFKMKEAFNFDGEFLGMSEESRNEKVRLLMGCISDHASVGISCYMPHRRYKEIFAGVQEYPENTPWGFMAENVIKALVDHQESLSLRGKIELIFDDEVRQRDAIRDNWRLFKESNPKIEHFLGDEPKFKDDKLWKPLQAADMFAGLIRDVKERTIKGLGHGNLLPLPTGAKKCRVLGFECTEERLIDLRRKVDAVVPYLTGTWGEYTLCCCFDPFDGESFSTVTTNAEAERFFRERVKKLTSERRRQSKKK